MPALQHTLEEKKRRREKEKKRRRLRALAETVVRMHGSLLVKWAWVGLGNATRPAHTSLTVS